MSILRYFFLLFLFRLANFLYQLDNRHIREDSFAPAGPQRNTNASIRWLDQFHLHFSAICDWNWNSNLRIYWKAEELKCTSWSDERYSHTRAGAAVGGGWWAEQTRRRTEKDEKPTGYHPTDADGDECFNNICLLPPHTNLTLSFKHFEMLKDQTGNLTDAVNTSLSNEQHLLTLQSEVKDSLLKFLVCIRFFIFMSLRYTFTSPPAFLLASYTSITDRKIMRKELRISQSESTLCGIKQMFYLVFLMHSYSHSSLHLFIIRSFRPAFRNRTSILNKNSIKSTPDFRIFLSIQNLYWVCVYSTLT